MTVLVVVVAAAVVGLAVVVVSSVVFVIVMDEQPTLYSIDCSMNSVVDYVVVSVDLYPRWWIDDHL